MKIKTYKFKGVILLLLVGAIWPFMLFSQESEVSETVQKSNIAVIPEENKALSSHNSIMVDSLENENLALKGLLKEIREEMLIKEREIATLKRKIDELENIRLKRLESSNDTLQRRLISMASNFLYIPYDEYSIEEIAIPAFISTKGTSAYAIYQNRLPLLQNYKNDVAMIIQSLIRMEKDLSIPFTALINQKANEHLNNLSSSPMYLRYVSYDDWENTYLGRHIYNIRSLLKSPSDKTASKLKKSASHWKVFLMPMVNEKFLHK